MRSFLAERTRLVRRQRYRSGMPPRRLVMLDFGNRCSSRFAVPSAPTRKRGTLVGLRPHARMPPYLTPKKFYIYMHLRLFCTRQQ